MNANIAAARFLRTLAVTAVAAIVGLIPLAAHAQQSAHDIAASATGAAQVSPNDVTWGN